MRSLLFRLGILGGLAALLSAGTMARAANNSTYRLVEDSSVGAGAFDLSTVVRARGKGEVRLCFRYRSPEDHWFVRLTNDAVSLVRVEAGKAETVAGPEKLKSALRSDPTTLLVKRRPEKIGVICRGTLVLVAGNLDAGTEKDKVGVSATGGLQAETPKVIPVEAPAFSDDFMREAGEASPWETPENYGVWSTTTVGDVKKSANGFSYRGSGNPGIAVTGYNFWDDYVYEASFKCTQESGMVGLAAYYQDPKNYLGLTWSSVDGLRLVRVLNGATTVLARKPVAWVPEQWYRLALQVQDGRLAAMVDGKLCLEAADASFGRGKVALLVDGKEAFFDDIAVKPAIYFHQAPPEAHRAEWFASNGSHIAGSVAWQDYSYRAKVTPDAKGVGLVFGWRDPKDYFLFQWDAERKRLVRVSGGQQATVAEAAGGCQAGKTYEVEVVFEPGHAAILVDDKQVLESADAKLSHGAVGLSPFSPAVKEVTVALREEPPPPEEEITKEFTISAVHPDMAEWANPAKEWVPRVVANGVVYWRKGEFMGDTSVHLPVPQLSGGARLTLSLDADGQNPDSGYVFAVERPSDTKVTVELLKQTTSVAKANGTVAAGQPGNLTIARHGAFLTADLNGKRLLEQPANDKPAGHFVGLRAGNVEMDLKDVQVRCKNVLDYTFHDAPVDWVAQTGIWEITNRWSCSPGWSWFGGRSERLAALWNKRRFSGDLVLEYYAGPKMDAVAEAYTERFRDLNATICGDGERLDSGYSFIIDGWHHAKTAILRGDRVVAENQTFHLPPQKTAHRQWFDIRITKHGNKISLSVDNAEILSYEDPDPLPGDRVALWTQNNGMMLARVVVGFEKEKEMPLVCRAPGKAAEPEKVAAAPETASLPILNDFESGMQQWRPGSAHLSIDATTAAHGKKSLEISNTEPGGEFKAVAVPGKFDAAQAKLLSFDYRIPAGVQVSLYVRIGQAYYAIGFTGKGEANPAAGVLASLGKIEGVKADDAWHHATFDLLANLRRFFPTANPLMVEEVVFANWEPPGSTPGADEYVLAGVTGNTLGCRYHIDRFAIGSTASEAAATPETKPAGPKSTAKKPKKTAVRPTKPGSSTKPSVKVATAKTPKGLAVETKPPVATPKPAPKNVRPAPAAGKPSKRPAWRIALRDAFTPGKAPIRWDSMGGKWVANAKGQFAPADKPDYAYAFAGDQNWGDYALKADLVNGQDAGLCVRAQDWNNCVLLVLRPAHHDLWWFVRRNGEWGGVLSPTALAFDPKPVINVKVLVRGDTYTCYLDGKQVSQIKDGTFKHGRIGLYIHPAEAGQAWDNVEVILPPTPGKAQAVARRE